MPTYEYECKSCSYNFDVFQSMSDPSVKDCPKCGKEVRRLIFGGAGVIFKGSGFYVTDKSKTGTKKPGGKPSDGKTETAAASPACAGCPAAKGEASCPAAKPASESKTA